MGVPAPLAACGTPPLTNGVRRAHSVWRDSLDLMKQHVPFGHRKVQVHDEVYVCGKPFDTLYLISTGLFKIMNLVPDGREQPAGFFFKGDWLGFDGIPTGAHTCSAVALDIGELWTVRYEALLKASVKEPLLMRLVLAAVSAQLARHRDASLSMGTLPADARVADFLFQWALSLEERGMRTDEFDLHLSRADIGSYLGLRLESVSRALSRLTRDGVIQFQEKGRRVISLPSLDALRAFIRDSSDHAADLH
jgi:CRP/FNR family transcriptional regulator